MIIDFDKKEPTERYHIMAGVVTPRPIAWIVTEGEGLNVAPFSYFSPLSSSPATLIVSIGHKQNGEPKDTLKNLREQKRCVVCMVEEEFLTKMDQSSKSLEYGESEFSEFDIPYKNVVEGFPPMVEGVKAAFFCEYLKEVEIGGSTVPVVLEIKYLYMDGEMQDLHPVARVGRGYARVGEKLEP
jgi:flavin reductase (DIM6/NTAB) family NADH-FMN oxidoreductase RutF